MTADILFFTGVSSVGLPDPRSDYEQAMPAGLVPADVEALVRAARRVVEAGSMHPYKRKLINELDQAAEAFAERVSWEELT